MMIMMIMMMLVMMVVMMVMVMMMIMVMVMMVMMIMMMMKMMRLWMMMQHTRSCPRDRSVALARRPILKSVLLRTAWGLNLLNKNSDSSYEPLIGV